MGRGIDVFTDWAKYIVVNNIETPSVLFENRLCGGPALEVELDWEGSPNARAIRTQLQLHTNQGSFYRRFVCAGVYLRLTIVND